MNRFAYVFVFAVLVFFHAPGWANDNQLTVKTSGGKLYTYNIELAVTPAEQRQGLMFRNHLPENDGMLFFFPQNGEHSFWMKNTLIPLDMIFIREDGVVHHIAANTIPLDTTPVPSNGVVRAVLEINGGQSVLRGIKPGDTVHHAVFNNLLAE